MKYSRLLIGLILLPLLVALSVWGIGDRNAEQFVQESTKRALIAFAIARGLNGVISVAQGSTLGMQPAGVGVEIAVGEILDPVNDLIERFSWVMLMSASALGVQQLLLKISTWWGFSILLAAAGVFWLAVRRRSKAQRVWSTRILGLVLFVRFALLGTMWLNEWVYQQFFASEYESAVMSVEQTQQRIQSLNLNPDQVEEPGWLDRIFGSEPLLPDLDALAETASRLTEHIVHMIAVFILQTLLLPLMFVWLAWRLIKAALVPVTPDYPVLETSNAARPQVDQPS